MPKPILTIIELSFPLASSDLGANILENEFMMKKLHLLQVNIVLTVLFCKVSMVL
jgi:chromosome transmission fidelity protein 4